MNSQLQCLILPAKPILAGQSPGPAHVYHHHGFTGSDHHYVYIVCGKKCQQPNNSGFGYFNIVVLSLGHVIQL